MVSAGWYCRWLEPVAMTPQIREICKLCTFLSLPVPSTPSSRFNSGHLFVLQSTKNCQGAQLSREHTARSAKAQMQASVRQCEH